MEIEATCCPTHARSSFAQANVVPQVSSDTKSQRVSQLLLPPFVRWSSRCFCKSFWQPMEPPFSMTRRFGGNMDIEALRDPVALGSPCLVLFGFALMILFIWQQKQWHNLSRHFSGHSQDEILEVPIQGRDSLRMDWPSVWGGAMNFFVKEWMMMMMWTRVAFHVLVSIHGFTPHSAKSLHIIVRIYDVCISWWQKKWIQPPLVHTNHRRLTLVQQNDHMAASVAGL
jgi:hypothetical protein